MMNSMEKDYKSMEHRLLEGPADDRQKLLHTIRYQPQDSSSSSLSSMMPNRNTCPPVVADW